MAITYTINSLISTYRAAKTWEPDAPFLKVHGEVLTAGEWIAWYRSCLSAKINRHLDTLAVDIAEMEYDRRRVEAYYHQGIRNSGCRGLLRTRYMRKRFPEVNNQAWEV
jgi:hypothetical protein